MSNPKSNNPTNNASQNAEGTKLTPREIEEKSRATAAQNRANAKNSKSNVDNILNDINSKQKKGARAKKAKAQSAAENKEKAKLTVQPANTEPGAEKQPVRQAENIQDGFVKSTGISKNGTDNAGKETAAEKAPAENAEKKPEIEMQIINIEVPVKQQSAAKSTKSAKQTKSTKPAKSAKEDKMPKSAQAKAKSAEGKVKRETVKKKNADAAIKFAEDKKTAQSETAQKAEKQKSPKTVETENNTAAKQKEKTAAKAEKTPGASVKNDKPAKPEKENKTEETDKSKKETTENSEKQKLFGKSNSADKAKKQKKAEKTEKSEKDKNNKAAAALSDADSKTINPTSKLRRGARRRYRAFKVQLFPIFRVLSKFFYEVGFYTEYAVVLAWRFIKKESKHGALLFVKLLKFLFSPVTFVGKEAWQIVTEPFKRMKRGLKNIRRVMHDQKENGFKKVREEVAVYFKRGVKDYHHLVTNLVMWTVAFVCFIAFIVTVSVAFNSDYVLELKVNDNVIGYVKNEEVFETAKQNLESQMVYTADNDQTLTFDPVYSIVPQGENSLSNSAQVLKSLLDKSGKDIKTATGLYVDGVFYGATTEATRLKNALEAIKAPYYDGDADTTVEFVQDVELVDGVYISDSVVPYSTLDEMLGSTVQGEVNYVIQKGDTLSGIASANGITQNELLSLNPQYADNATYYPGDVLVISKAQSFLQVKVVKRIVEQVAIPHGSTQTQSDSVSFGVRKVVTAGVDGSKDVTSDITYIDGVAVDKTIVQEVVTLEPVTEEVVIGTYLAPGIQGVPGSGQLMWPVPGYNYMSRGFAGLYPAHNGLDICANYGTPIYAADNGVVTRAAYANTGYGIHVFINHGNGLSTVYAHCSSLAVTNGQYVTKGQIIGYVGSTGWSTGNHCHFEVRVNNVTVNPLGGYVSP